MPLPRPRVGKYNPGPAVDGRAELDPLAPRILFPNLPPRAEPDRAVEAPPDRYAPGPGVDLRA